MDILATYIGNPNHDPALLAFVKCHVTSFLRWDILRLLVEQEGRWTDVDELSRLLHRPSDAVENALHDLAQESVIETHESDHREILVRLDPAGPSTRVVERLVTAATRNHGLRQIIVARVVAAAPGS